MRMYGIAASGMASAASISPRTTCSGMTKWSSTTSSKSPPPTRKSRSCSFLAYMPHTSVDETALGTPIFEPLGMSASVV